MSNKQVYKNVILFYEHFYKFIFNEKKRHFSIYVNGKYKIIVVILVI